VLNAHIVLFIGLCHIIRCVLLIFKYYDYQQYWYIVTPLINTITILNFFLMSRLPSILVNHNTPTINIIYSKGTYLCSGLNIQPFIKHTVQKNSMSSQLLLFPGSNSAFITYRQKQSRFQGHHTNTK